MKCKECKEAILLIRELEETERERLNKHIQTCLECKQLYEETKQFSLIIERAASAKPIVVNEVASADTIMDRILQEKRSSSRARWSLSSFFYPLWPRYSLAGISICLIVFFVMEVNRPTVGRSKEANATSAKASFILQSKSLRINFSRSDDTKFLVMAHCLPSQFGKIDINCIKQKMRSSNL